MAGGFSGESDISMKSAQTILVHLDTELFEPYLVKVDAGSHIVMSDEREFALNLSRFSFEKEGEEVIFDYAYIIIHGTPGEDGKIQGYLDVMGIPYSTGSVLNMSLTFNKAATQRLMIQHDIPVAKHLIFREGERPETDFIVKELGLPCFVKPTESGSSIGVAKVDAVTEMDAAIDAALDICGEVIIESMLKGRELACGVYKAGNETMVLPVTEIIPPGDFFDYEAKYDDAETKEITPASISAAAYERCQELSKLVYDITDCAGIARADFFLCGDDLYLVEINTIPGMSAESLVPKQLRTADIELKELLTQKIQSDLKRHKK